MTVFLFCLFVGLLFFNSRLSIRLNSLEGMRPPEDLIQRLKDTGWEEELVKEAHIDPKIFHLVRTNACSLSEGDRKRLEYVLNKHDAERANYAQAAELMKEEDLMQKVHFRLREAREQLNMTQTDLAKVSGLSQGFINAVEAGEKDVKLSVAVQLAKNLGRTVDEMIVDDL